MCIRDSPIHGDQFEHVPAGEQLNAAQLHLAHQGLVGAIKQLLSGLLNPANGPSIRWGGRLLASGIGGGFLLISLGLALGGLA